MPDRPLATGLARRQHLRRARQPRVRAPMARPRQQSDRSQVTDPLLPDPLLPDPLLPDPLLPDPLLPDPLLPDPLLPDRLLPDRPPPDRHEAPRQRQSPRLGRASRRRNLGRRALTEHQGRQPRPEVGPPHEFLGVPMRVSARPVVHRAVGLGRFVKTSHTARLTAIGQHAHRSVGLLMTIGVRQGVLIGVQQRMLIGVPRRVAIGVRRRILIGVPPRPLTAARNQRRRLLHAGRMHVPTPVRAVEARRSAPDRRVVAWSAAPTRSAPRRVVARAPTPGQHRRAQPESAKAVGDRTGHAPAAVLCVSSAASDVPLRLTL
jgi:hypothetical protein